MSLAVTIAIVIASSQLVHLVDNTLDRHPGLTIVLGGDTNQLDLNELCQLKGWNSLVDFPTRGVRIWIMSLQIDRTCLGNVLRFLYQ